MSLYIEKSKCLANEYKEVSPGSVYGNRLVKFNGDKENHVMLVYANESSLFTILHSPNTNERMSEDDGEELQMSKHDKVPIPVPFSTAPIVGKFETNWKNDYKNEICNIATNQEAEQLAVINRIGQIHLYQYNANNIVSLDNVDEINDLEEGIPKMIKQKRKLAHQGFTVKTTFPSVSTFKCAVDPDHASIAFMPNNNLLAAAHRFSREIKFLDIEKQVESLQLNTQCHINTILPLCENTIAVAEHNRLVIYDIRSSSPEMVGQNNSKHCHQRFTNDSLWQQEEIHSIAKSKVHDDYNIAIAGSQRSVQFIDQRKWSIMYKWQSALKYDVNYIDIHGDFCVAAGFTHPEVRACILSKNQSGQSIHSPSRFIGCTGLYSLGQDSSTSPYRLDLLTDEGELFSMNHIDASI